MAEKASMAGPAIIGGGSSDDRAEDDDGSKAKPKGGGGTEPEIEIKPSMKRSCACCKKHLPKSNYSKTQWSKNNTAKCKSCITEQQQSGVSRNSPAPGGRQLKMTLIPLERTEAYRVRRNKSITPKDRLIKYCEMGCIMDLGEVNNGRILPEKIQTPSANGDIMMSIPYTITPYEYWGLPREGALHGSNIFKKKIWKRCDYFFDHDLNWLVENAELVQPFFDEVATEGDRSCDGFVFEGVSWAEQIELLKDEIALFRIDEDLAEEFDAMGMNDNWQPPTESDAYQVRSSNTIAPKDRLLHFCELSSLNENGCIEPESGVPSFPPRQTTNRYWGISPHGGRSAADNTTWDNWMDLEIKWLRNHAALVQPHFEEVAGMGYANSIVTVSYVISRGGANTASPAA
eukprot:CAMPEP_0113416696 /NCGR_PEP_ID=MMETSP0013_2-20120614/25255_1 /TAXON_ID=2843 ORGANISM="Skeletonema costatum, Strain 1716" /NCGR_SAMPLE_ID=MMETSP0013_2 /ASSEMBLY_ACC=CAM_ASM_000158 /LENGTH=400 /DNA_ID=CAMNT_0000303771 /DNA_START=5 /DNA_END=1207 /DNA_ORIENTATION=+ /assembly_acc=CAM_ASM_000158